MTSFTGRSRARAGLWLGAICLFAFFGTHLSLQALCRWLESRHGAYLWRTEEWLQLFTPTSYLDRGAGRILLAGASEAREGFLPDAFEAALPGVEAYQNSVSLGVIDDIPILLEYLEGAYGAGAVPDRLVVGVAFRMAMNYTPGRPTSPLQEAIQRYSPAFGLDTTTSPARLVPKDRRASLASRLRLLSHEGERYRRGLRASLVLAWMGLTGTTVDEGWRRELGLVPARFYDLRPRNKARYEETPTPYLELADVRPAEHADELRRSFERLRAVAGRHGTRVYIVNLPEGPWMRGYYPDGVYEDYETLLREASDGLPFLDLRWFLGADEFFDWSHPTLAGAQRVSERVARFVAETDDLRGR